MPRAAAHRPTAITPTRAIQPIPPDVLDQFMATAYQLYTAGRYAAAEVICRGLIAADPTYWYPYSLHAAALQRLGRFQEALAQVQVALRCEPGNARLIVLRRHIARCAASRRSRYTSRLRTLSAFCSMNSRRGSTKSPMSVEKRRSAS